MDEKKEEMKSILESTFVIDDKIAKIKDKINAIKKELNEEENQ